jgi:two-component system cell cycle sensor histidine kinase/response regulator CckA
MTSEDDTLKANEARFRAVVEKSLGAVTLSRADGTRLYASEAVGAMLGYTPAEFLELTRHQQVHPDDRPRIERELRELFERPGHSIVTEWRAIHRDGSIVWLEATLTNLFDEPAVRALVAHFRDVTDRKRAEEALRESRTLLEQAQALACMGSWTGSTDPGEPLQYSDECYRILGLPIGQRITPADFFARVHPDDIDRVHAAISGAAERCEAYEVEFRIRRPQGELRWVHTRAKVQGTTASGATAMIGVVRDITDQRRAEEQLRQAAKMEAVGSLAGGVAHDFNNLLQVVVGYTSLVLDALPPDAPMRAEIEQVRNAGDRAVALTGQLLAFSRRQVLKPVVLDLNAVVLDFERMFRRLLGEGIALVVSTEPGLGLVAADPSQLQQVIMNLAINARDAMPHGGTLTIETRNCELDEAHCAKRVTVKPGHYVALRISDTGAGIDETIRERIFEPFFTTKEMGKGTGLGLSTVFGIVSQSGGHIEVDSGAGRGSVFTVYLPQSERTLEGHGAQAELALRNGSETILLVEDDDTVRALTRAVLSRGGYQVLEAQNAGEALLIGEQHPGAIHLLLTDLVMPRIGGRVLAERLLRARPGMKVAFMSGYADDLANLQGLLDSGAVFIPKPVVPAALQRMIREVLDG